MLNKRILHSLLFITLLLTTFFGFFPITKASAATGNFTVNNGIVYKNGSAINFHGVNWSGFDGSNHIVSGLWTRNWHDMLDQMKSVGFNSVRLSLCPDSFHGSWVNGIDYSKNPDLSGLNSSQILDKFAAEFQSKQMYFLFDFHSVDCYSNSDKWYGNGYSETQWISDMKQWAQKLINNDYFIGWDLKNEPHLSATWGTGNEWSDFNTAAEKAGQALLSVNPNILIFIDGIGDNPKCTDYTYSMFWGENLQPFNCNPISTSMIPANKMVLSPHIYGPDVYGQWYFYAGNFPNNMPAIWDQHFGFVTDKGAILIPGEWGGKYGNGGDYRDYQLQNKLVDYYIQKHICNSFYWSWNPDSSDTGGILKDDWNSVWANKVSLLQRYFSSCSDSGSVVVTPNPTPTPTPSDPNSYRGDYYTNMSLSGNPAFSRNDQNINFDWTNGSPDQSIPSDGFSARWTKTINVTSGKYKFTTSSDDGVRLYIDNNLIIDKWINQATAQYDGYIDLSSGDHSVKLEYYENTGGAVMKFSYTKMDQGNTQPSGFTGYTGEYFNNPNLSGNPLLKYDNNVNFDWGNSSPDQSINSDNFSARWTKTENFTSGKYRFNITADDGFRLKIDGQVVLEKWFEQAATSYSIDKDISGGNHNIVLEYFEHYGNALAKMNYSSISSSTPSPTPVPNQQSSCQIKYTIINDWGSGHTAKLEIKNTGNNNINNWTLNWSMPGNENVTALWNGIYNNDSKNPSVKNEWWNANLSPNGTAELGFNVNLNGSNGRPTMYSLNGMICSITN